jgi:two-component system sensor histidine kinase SenX3
MNFPFKDRVLTWAMPIVLACVLVLLAVLQYRWSRQTSEAATTRMQASLQNSLMNFRQDVAREFATMCLELQQDNPSQLDAKSLAQRLEEWQRTSWSSGLIANVYQWNRSDTENASLERLAPAEGRFETIPWPSRLDRLHELLTGSSSGEGVPERSPVPVPISGESQPREGNDPIVGGIDESIPVLIIPATRNAQSSWLLVELDPQVLRERVFPQLAERYLGDPRTSEYAVAVVADGSGQAQVLYSSDPGFGHDGEAGADAALNLFGPPSAHGGAAPLPVDFLRSLRGASDNRQDSSTPSGQSEWGFYKIRFDPVRGGEDKQGSRSPNWRIVARHRKGSVAAAVAELRYRNLEISFGVLLVLAASMALIIFNSQRARRLAMLQMDFVAAVSHELRTPVAAILSISENIVDGIVEDEQQLLRYGGMMKNQAKRLNHLVEQVLRFAATQRSMTDYTIRTLQIADVIDEVLENMANLVSASGFVIHRSIEAELPLVEADFRVLSQCLQNLITNAIKYGGEDKWIGVRAASSGAGPAREVRITVEDHGIGIDHGELKHIFEPFYRSPKVAESQVHGTGLGLALARSFAEAMGGRLTVVSEPGQGSAFTLHLPEANAAGARKKGALAAEPAEG